MRRRRQTACAVALAENPPSLDVFTGLEPNGDPHCASVGDKLDVLEIAPGVFAHMGRIAEPDRGNGGDVANLGFVVGQEAVAVIDTGSARWIGEALWRAFGRRRICRSRT